MKTKRLRRFLSVLAATALLSSAAAVSASADAGDTLTSINVEAFSGLAPMNNGQKAWAEAVTPVDGLEQPGVKLELSAGQTVDKAWAWEPNGAAWDPRAQLTTESGNSSNGYSSSGTPLDITDSTGLVFYVKLPSANTVCVSPNYTSATDKTLTVGAPYYV